MELEVHFEGSISDLIAMEEQYRLLGRFSKKMPKQKNE